MVTTNPYLGGYGNIIQGNVASGNVVTKPTEGNDHSAQNDQPSFNSGSSVLKPNDVSDAGGQRPAGTVDFSNHYPPAEQGYGSRDAGSFGGGGGVIETSIMEVPQ